MNLRSGSEAVSSLNTASIAPKRRRRVLQVGYGLALMLVLFELAGRHWGLHHPVIFERTTYGYRVVPNQDILRFGNRAFFNALGLRSETTTALPAAGVVRVLCLGDSVTYGGPIMDQTDTYPYRLGEQLTGLPESVEVLNASAPGWAIDNEMGWLRENGALGSRYVILTISTHDLFQPLASASVVGSHPAYPDRQPEFAIEEIAVRYVWPRLAPWISIADPGVGGHDQWSDEQARANLDTVLLMEQIVRQSGGSLVVLLSSESIDPRMDSLAATARQRMVEALARKNVSVLTIDDAINRLGRSFLYRDTVHPNPEGNRAMAIAAADYLRPRIAAVVQGRGRMEVQSR